MKILLTGVAGFIGYHVARRLLTDGHTILGIDNLNEYYDPQLKRDRLCELGINMSGNRGATAIAQLKFICVELADKESVSDAFESFAPDVVIHLAAQAGVRYSIDNPDVYVQSNVVGFLHIIEGCRRTHVKHLVFASSSSIYGANVSMPYSVSDPVDHPMSLYAATKRANELMAHTYSHLYDLPCTGLRFFTVYGPWGRPDMAPIIFAKAIFEGKPIDVYNFGDMKRDFTYIDDIVEGITRCIELPPVKNESWEASTPNPAVSYAPFVVHNIGRGQPVALMDFIDAMERAAGVEAKKNLLPLQPGDVKETFADTQTLELATGYSPKVSIEEGVARFISWYRRYYRV